MAHDLHSLPLFHRIAGTLVIVIGSGEMAAAKRRLIERAGGICCTEVRPARLGFVAVEDRVEAEAAAFRLKARGVLVNVADRPELCDFTLPSLLERGPVVVAVGTGGASAGLAKHVRLRIEAFLPTSLGALAQGLAGARDALRARWPDPTQRRGALDAALAENGPLDPLAPGSVERLGAWLTEPDIAPASRTVEIVLTSDDPDDLTLTQARLLGMADTLVHAPQMPPTILARARADARRLFPGDPLPDHGLVVILTCPPSRG